MRKKHNTEVYALLLLLAFVYSVSAQASLLSFDPDKIPDYDYSQPRLTVLHHQNGYVFLANPFEHPVPSAGALVYEIILLYVPQLQTFPGVPEEPTYIIDLIMEDSYGAMRLGQRLFVGDPWISDGKSLALMKPEDHKILKNFLRKRLDRQRSMTRDVWEI